MPPPRAITREVHGSLPPRAAAKPAAKPPVAPRTNRLPPLTGRTLDQAIDDEVGAALIQFRATIVKEINDLTTLLRRNRRSR